MLILFLLGWIFATLLAYVIACWCRSKIAYLLPAGVWCAGLALWGIIFQY